MISSVSFQIVHRDLAARNVLVTKNNIIKIADVGLARQIDKDYYAMNNGGMVPIASMAIETFENKCYSTQTDIWSYGVLLWEMFSFGLNPLDGYYPALGPKDIYNFLKSNHRLNRPKYSPLEMYEKLNLHIST
jgi:serine/threonine protein kinase